jgi:hypothetical protein
MAAVGLIVASELWLLALLTAVTIVVLLELAPLSDLVLKRSREEGFTHGDAVPGDEEDDQADSEEDDGGSKK